VITPVGSAEHQGIGFLIRNDMVQHDVMQALLRTVAGEWARTQAAETLRINNPTPLAAVELGVSESLSGLTPAAVALLQHPGAIHPAVGVQATNLWSATDADRHEEDVRDDSSSDDAAVESKLDEIEQAIVRGVAERLPELAAAGFCRSMFVALFAGNPVFNTHDELWQHHYVAIMIPQHGTFGVEQKVFAYGLSPQAPLCGMSGQHLSDEDALLSRAVLSVLSHPEGHNFWPASVTLNRVCWQGRMCSVGVDAVVPELHYVLDLDCHSAAQV